MPFYNDIKSFYNISSRLFSSPKYNFGLYAQGYHQAANVLSKDFLAKPGCKAYEAYPIVFLYRHAFELYLKNIIYWSTRLCAFKNIDSIEDKLHNNHDLKKLSVASVNILNLLYPKDKWLKEIIPNIQVMANEFSDIDPDSYSYRYPINKKGEYPGKKRQVINMTSVAINMDKFLDNLYKVNCGLSGETEVAEGLFELLENFSKN